MKHLFIKIKESLTHVLTRIKRDASKKITLVIPREALILKNLDNLQEIKKKAKILKKKVKFISNDPRMAKKPKKIIKRQAKKHSVKNQRLSSVAAKSFIIFIFIVMLLTSATLYLILPKADIIIEPKKEPISVDLNIIIDQSAEQVNLQTNTIPGELKTLEDQVVKRFNATGKKYIESKARGVITVYNNSKPQVWREETRFETPEGLIFKSLKFEKIPLGTKDIEVQADESGPEYNIPASTFVIPAFREQKSSQYALITGKSENPMTGGAKQELLVVSQEDIDNAKQEVQQELREKLLANLSSEVYQEEILLEESSVLSGREASAFNINLKMAITTIDFAQQDLLDLIEQNLLARISANKELSNEPEISYGEVEIDFENGQMIVPVNVVQEVSWKIESDKIHDQLAGKNPEEVKYILERQAGVVVSEINLWPFWVKTIPDKINIKIK